MGKTKDVGTFEQGVVVGFMCIKNGPPPKRHPANLTKLWEVLASTWASIPVEHFQHLVDSIPRRTEAVLRAKRGSATQY
jgi:hypothetical protein